MKPRGQYRGPGYQPCFALHASTGYQRKKFWMPVWDWNTRFVAPTDDLVTGEIGKIECKMTRLKVSANALTNIMMDRLRVTKVIASQTGIDRIETLRILE